MRQPEVRMVCLYADRPQFLASMLRSFRSQTYKNSRLLIYDNGRDPMDKRLILDHTREILVRERSVIPRSIGALRNAANSLVAADIIVHADVDDWSAPERLSEQVSLLQLAEYEAVGFNEMIFWNSACNGCEDSEPLLSDYNESENPGTNIPERWHGCALGPHLCQRRAWRYHNRDRTFGCGTSLCYWRKTWERVKFPDIGPGEDTFWIEHGVKCLGVSGIVDGEPRLIATLHSSNTGSQIVRGSLEWQRAPEYDAKVRAIMESA